MREGVSAIFSGKTVGKSDTDTINTLLGLLSWKNSSARSRVGLTRLARRCSLAGAALAKKHVKLRSRRPPRPPSDAPTRFSVYTIPMRDKIDISINNIAQFILHNSVTLEIGEIIEIEERENASLCIINSHDCEFTNPRCHPKLRIYMCHAILYNLDRGLTSLIRKTELSFSHESFPQKKMSPQNYVDSRIVYPSFHLEEHFSRSKFASSGEDSIS
ncbi:hypothetical protein DBV15_05941 [Temnothorax longispinosus]|uniref:Uncharacterized protein n=1 Tax=Temnothorax longispinosus TaxID=300112 RepID=A0A4S2KPN4_9HYME|nr:hypothetical protein DBV15_05941 [Temnothorax longispinosus]